MAYQASKGALRRRPEAQRDTGVVSEGTRAQTLANAVVARNNAEGYAREIGKLWGEAQQKFLAIGRYLCLAKRTLEHGEFERMVASIAALRPERRASPSGGCGGGGRGAPA
jgi:hypothetical protein